MWVIVGPEREGFFASAGQMHHNSQVAHTLWPDRMHEVCKHHCSIAVARGLEELCDVPEKTSKKRGKKRKTRGQESQTASLQIASTMSNQTGDS
jgi:hypothetical protein